MPDDLSATASRCQGEEEGEDASDVSQPEPKHAARIFASLPHEAKNLQGDHRHDARHEVEEQAAEEGAPKQEKEILRQEYVAVIGAVAMNSGAPLASIFQPAREPSGVWVTITPRHGRLAVPAWVIGKVMVRFPSGRMGDDRGSPLPAPSGGRGKNSALDSGGNPSSSNANCFGELRSHLTVKGGAESLGNAEVARHWENSVARAPCGSLAPIGIARLAWPFLHWGTFPARISPRNPCLEACRACRDLCGRADD